MRKTVWSMSGLDLRCERADALQFAVLQRRDA